MPITTYKTDKQKKLLYKRNYTQYFEITYQGNLKYIHTHTHTLSLYIYIHIYIYLNHFTVHLKLIQHCKLFRLKKLERSKNWIQYEHTESFWVQIKKYSLSPTVFSDSSAPRDQVSILFASLPFHPFFIPTFFTGEPQRLL